MVNPHTNRQFAEVFENIFANAIKKKMNVIFQTQDLARVNQTDKKKVFARRDLIFDDVSNINQTVLSQV